jgi:hypothetical protein
MAEANVVTIWERVQRLNTRTVHTVKGIPFEITAVNENSVKIKVRSGNEYYISRREFESAEELGMVTSRVEPGQLRKAGVSEGNPAYVAGIIRAIANAPH